MKQGIWLIPLFAGIACSAQIKGEITGCEMGELPCHYRRLFVSTSTTDGDIGGRSGANALCQSDAQAAGLTQNYIAYLTTSDASALSFFDSGNTPFLRNASGTAVVVAATLSSFTSGQLLAAPNTHASGTAVSSMFYTWTGSPTVNCSNWSSTAGNGRLGHITQTDEDAIFAGTLVCNGMLEPRLYCIATQAGD